MERLFTLVTIITAAIGKTIRPTRPMDGDALVLSNAVIDAANEKAVIWGLYRDTGARSGV